MPQFIILHSFLFYFLTLALRSANEVILLLLKYSESSYTTGRYRQWKCLWIFVNCYFHTVDWKLRCALNATWEGCILYIYFFIKICLSIVIINICFSGRRETLVRTEFLKWSAFIVFFSHFVSKHTPRSVWFC